MGTARKGFLNDMTEEYANAMRDSIRYLTGR